MKSEIILLANVVGGKACIAGTRVSVHSLAAWYKRGFSAEEIATEYPQLHLAQIYAALSYYHAHRSTIDAELREEEALYEHYAAEYAPHHASNLATLV